MIKLDLRSSQPIYEQIVSQYKYLCLQGYLKKGDSIPSVRRMAMDLSITPGTVAKAYREMEQIGMIETIRGKGTFIASRPETVRDEKEIRKVREEMKENCLELIYQGLEKKEILALVEEVLDSLTEGMNK